MNKKTNYRFFVICILGMLSYVASAQITGKVSNVLNSEMCKDSALLEARKYVDTQVDSSGDTLIVYKYKPFELDLSSAQDLERNDNDEIVTDVNVDNQEELQVMPPPIYINTSVVGKIPITEGVSPTGARTYEIPIMTAANCKLTPDVSLIYNSQSGNGVAGFGWDVKGYSSISVVGKSLYYDGKTTPVDLSKPEKCAFALDGVRLVDNLGPLEEYQYETAQGFILVKKHMSGENVAYFTVAYPNGNTATFGFTDNKDLQVVYPITELCDSKGFRIDFSYERSGNCLYLTKIQYGSMSRDNHPAEMVFNYVERDDFTTIYIGGVAMTANRLLCKIVSSDIVDGRKTVLREYNLTHETKGVKRLVALNCTCKGTHRFQGLTFQYGTAIDDHKPSLINDGQNLLAKFFPTSKENNLAFIRGKLLKNDFNDGLVVLPACFDSWGVVGVYVQNTFGSTKVYPAYGSNYPENQTILISPSLSDWYRIDSIKTEKGFQTIQAVDINGDGTDNIVKVNVVGAGKNYTRFSVTEYSYNTGSLTSQSFTFSINHSYNNGNKKYSPAQSSYFWGDFVGNGKVQLLVATLDQKDKMKLYVDLVDLNNKMYIGESLVLSNYDSKSGEPFCVVDIDGDGKAELCHATETGVEIFVLEKNRFNLQRIDDTINSVAFYHSAIWGDVNGDGKLDVLVSPLKSSKRFEMCRVPVWSKPYCPFCKAKEPTIDSDNVCRFCGGDIKQYWIKDRHGLRCRICEEALVFERGEPVCSEHGRVIECEICTVDIDNGSKWTLYTSTGKSFVKSTMEILRCYDDQFMLMDVNKDGLADLLHINEGQVNIYLNDKGVLNDSLLCGVAISDNAHIIPSNVCNFHNMSNFIIVDDAVVKSYSYSRDFTRLNLLTRMRDSFMNCHYNDYGSSFGFNRNYIITSSCMSTYPYSPLVQPINLLNYSNITSSDDSSLLAKNSYTFYDGVWHNEGLGFLGFEKVVTRDWLSDQISTEIHNPKMFGVVTRVETPEKITETSYNCPYSRNKKNNVRIVSMKETNLLTGMIVSKNMSYDEYNNVTKEITSYGTLQNVGQTTSYKNLLTSQCYLIGLPLSVESTTIRNGNSWTTSKLLTYNDDNLLVKNVSCIGGKKQSETHYTYDSYGNVTSKKTAPYNSQEFIGETFVYGDNGRCLRSYTDALGHTTTYSKYDMFGNPCEMTDYKGRITKYGYDVTGEKNYTLYPDGVLERVEKNWGGIGLYTIKYSNNSKPASIVHYDSFEREIRNGVLRFDGSWQFVDRIYDRRGKISKISLPFIGDAPAEWNNYEYDEFGRPVKYVEASGKMSSWSYDGCNTTETKDGVVTVRTIDNVGQLVKVEDPGGIIEYNLRADGQPSEVVAPGNVVTKFKYDEFGRKVAIEDPSFGLQVFEEKYDNDGTRHFTSTDANGNVVSTVYDKLGRKTNETRPEFSTAYTYDGDGNVTSESSTNGVLTTFVYDDYGRLQKKVKSIGNKSIEKSFVYIDGKLNSEAITLNSGVSQPKVFTLNYEYANNHMEKVTLDNTTTLYRLFKENEFGQPTEIVTGGMARLYDYDAFGLPTRRRSGTIQDFSYTFNPLNNNLLSRTDNKRGIKECFAYDVMNRLSGIGDKQVVYADNGNLLSMPDVGVMEYRHETKPYAVTGLLRDNSSDNSEEMVLEYNSFHCPSYIKYGYNETEFVYDANGNRVAMTNGSCKKYYLDEYEIDGDGSMQILYLCGDAYSAPMAYVKKIMSPSWMLVNICRDHLGSITHIANADGVLLREYSYDAWGKMREPETQEVYPQGSEPDLFLGRGYTSHEHLSQYGLVNMNARLYDPETGRFLSPDAYVQLPDNTQSFNRYSYCLNNPLKYVDKDGNIFFLFTPFAAIGNTLYNIFAHGVNFDHYNWKVLRNAWKIDSGMFMGNALQILNKWTWGFVNSYVGNMTAHVLNVFGKVDKVTAFDGMLALSGATSGNSAFTVGHYSFGPKGYVADWRDHLFVHEYGHYIQSQHFGPLYFQVVAIPSLLSACCTSSLSGVEHKSRWFEKDASGLGANYFDRHYGKGAKGYDPNSPNFFDVNSFWNEYTTKYKNPRLKNSGPVNGLYRQDKRFSSKTKLLVWDFIF